MEKLLKSYINYKVVNKLKIFYKMTNNKNVKFLNHCCLFYEIFNKKVIQ